MIGTLIDAWLDVRSKPLRTLASIAGMVAAIVAVVLVDAAGVLSHDANNTYLARQYGLPITVNIQAENSTPSRDDERRLETTLRENGIVALSPSMNIPVDLVYESSKVFGAVRFVSSAYAKIRIVDMVAGSWPTETAQSDVLHVVLDAGWAQQALGLTDEQVVGQVLGYVPSMNIFDARTTALHPMIVDGVVAVDTNAFGNGNSPISVVSDLPPSHLLSGKTLSLVWVARVNPEDYGYLQDLVATVTDTNGQAIYRAQRADSGETLAPVLDQQDVTTVAVIVVALTVGGLGILGVGLASVRERGRDFGLRRALGASTIRIFGGVIAQSLLEALLAAVIAIPLAAIVVELFTRRLVLASLPLPPSVGLPLQSALIGLGGAIAIGLLAGLLPAFRAARTSVVQALRE